MQDAFNMQAMVVEAVGEAAGVLRLQDADPDAEHPQMDLMQCFSFGHALHQPQLLRRLSGKGLLCTTRNPQRNTYVLEGHRAGGL